MNPNLPLAIVLAIADAALALSFGTPIAWGLMGIPLIAVFMPMRVPPRLATALTWTAWALVPAVVPRGSAIVAPAGMALGALGGVFLLDTRAFPVHRAFMPAVLGVLLAAASNASAPRFTLLAALAALTLTFWLAAESPRLKPGALARVVFIAVAAAVAYGLIVLLPWAQPRVEEATAKYKDPSIAATGLSIGGNLGDVQRLALSSDIVLRMWSADPMDLRAGVYTQFDGRGWRPGRVVPRSHPAPQLLAGPSTGLARFVVEQMTLGSVPAPPNVVAVDAGDRQITVDRFDLLHALPRAPDRYAVRFSPGPLRAADGDDDVVRECLQVPASVDPRVRELAGQLGSDSATAKEKIDRTLSHLQGRCRYSLDVGAFATSDPLAEFLFDKKKGYCEYFATATVMLLRLQGVPARYVNGLSVRDADRRADHFVVRASDAHAWAEALIPGTGWVEVDSTPPGDYAAVHGGGHSWIDDAIEAIKSQWIDMSAARAAVTIVVVFAAIAAAVIAIRRLGRRRRQPVAVPRSEPLNVRPELMACLRRVEDVWTRAGHPRPRHRAPLEHLDAMPPDAVPAPARAATRAVVLQFYRSAYGGQDVALGEIARLDRALDLPGR